MNAPDNKPSRIPRIPLIDALRGLALIAMASYHFTWDLEFFGYVDPGTATHGFFRAYARCIASTFLFLAGVSLVLAHTPELRWPAFWRRLRVVAGAALAVSVATYFIFADEWIYFGILHNIALSGLIGMLFVRRPLILTLTVFLLLVLAMLVDYVWMPGLLDTAAFNTRFLGWIGFAEMPARSNDYVPLFPWIAALLAGIAITRIAHARGWLERLAKVQAKPNLLSFAGRHSLVVYLIHQPILLAGLYLFSMVHPAPPPDVRKGYILSCQASCMQGANDAKLCASFCGCTGDRLISENLMAPLQSGQITPQDERIVKLAQECSISAEQTPP